MTIGDELKIVQDVIDGLMNQTVFFISDYGFFDMSRYSVPSDFHCNLVTLIDDPRPKLMRNLKNLSSMPMKSTLSCQFCGN